MSRALAWRAVLALALLGALGIAAQATLVATLLTPWRTVIELLEPDFRVLGLQAAAGRAEPVIELVVAPARVIVVGGRAVAADPSGRAMSSTPRGGVWLLLAVFMATLIAWPAEQPAREGLRRALVGLPVLALVLLVDIPISLLGPLREVIVGELAPGSFDAWVLGSQFLRGGGRVLVGVAGAAAVCLWARRPAP